ncbi:MAG: LPS assembly protein LptD [Syntrophorhabdaceae bacterium]|nr:LPS assembly protein LptD [Syntrophorhabdaceae bacterium]
MRFFSYIFLFSAFFLAILSQNGEAKKIDLKSPLDRPVEISARSLEYNKEKGLYTAKGNVELAEGERILKADFIVYNEQTGDIEAQGNVVFQEDGDTLQCDSLKINIFTKTGIINRGKIFIKKGNFNIFGEQIEKTGDVTYRIKGSEITTCDPKLPEWKFYAKDVDLTIEGYAKTKGTVFYILNKPVFYLPYGIFPVKTERQSGFLMPLFQASSKDGMVIKNSFFWAIAKDKDATLSLDYIEQRGFNFGTEFRYHLTEDTKGIWYGAIMDDKSYNHSRYRIKGMHEQDFPLGMKMKMDIDHVSDIDYLKDMSTKFSERSESQLKSTVYFEKPLSSSLFTYELAYFKNLLVKDNDMTFKYAPHMTYFTESFPFIQGFFFFDLSSSLTNFYRETGDRYSRLSFEPKVQFPYAWNGLNFLFSGKMYETDYLIHRAIDDSKTTRRRQTFKIEGNSNIQLVKDYYRDRTSGYQSLIKPEIKYIFIPNSSFRDLPYIDPYDRILKTNVITYSLNHFLTEFKRGENKEISLFQIEQTYGLSGILQPSTLYEGYGKRFSDAKARLTFILNNELSLIHESVINVYGEGYKKVNNTFSYNRPGMYNMNLSHSYTKSLDNQLFADLGATYKVIDGRYQIRYSIKDGMWIDTLYQIVYHPGCWAVTLTLQQTKRPRDTSFKFAFDLAGITKMK